LGKAGGKGKVKSPVFPEKQQERVTTRGGADGPRGEVWLRGIYYLTGHHRKDRVCPFAPYVPLGALFCLIEKRG